MKYLIKLSSGKVSIMNLIEGDLEDALVGFEANLAEDIIVGVREISEDDIPASREFRDAWVDVTDASNVDIDVSIAKAVKLNDLRAKRNRELDNLDPQFLKALSVGDEVKLAEIKAEQQKLRDITEPLKALQVSGINDDEALANIKALGDVL